MKVGPSALSLCTLLASFTAVCATGTLQAAGSLSGDVSVLDHGQTLVKSETDAHSTSDAISSHPWSVSVDTSSAGHVSPIGLSKTAGSEVQIAKNDAASITTANPVSSVNSGGDSHPSHSETTPTSTHVEQPPAVTKTVAYPDGNGPSSVESGSSEAKSDAGTAKKPDHVSTTSGVPKVGSDTPSNAPEISKTDTEPSQPAAESSEEPKDTEPTAHKPKDTKPAAHTDIANPGPTAKAADGDSTPTGTVHTANGPDQLIVCGSQLVRADMVRRCLGTL